MLENILWKKYFCPVRHYAGDVVRVSNNDRDATTTDVQVPANVPQIDRAMILGRQAAAIALAGDTNGEIFKTDEDEYDAKDKHRTVMRWMGGMAKVQQRTRSGKLYDMGVAVIDSASKPVRNNT